MTQLLDADSFQAGNIHITHHILLVTSTTTMITGCTYFDTESRGLKARNFRIWMHNFRLRGSLLAVYGCFVQHTICYYRSTTP